MQIKTLLSFSQGIVVWIPNRHCERLKGAWQSRKKIKKMLKISIFTGLLRQLLRNFPRNDEKLGNARKLIIILFVNIIISGNATELLATCNISVPTVSFGSFAVSSVRTTSVSASVTCSGLLSLLVSYTVTFSTGSANIYNPRSMASGVNRLNYNLYKDAAFTQILGNGTSSTVTFTDSYLLGLGPVTRTYTVYARLPSQPLAAAGTFQDTITATVTQP